MATTREAQKLKFLELVGFLEKLMKQSVRAEYGGYYGNVTMPVQAATRLGPIPATRRAARIAGERLGWDTYTYLIDGLFIVRDRRQPPEDIRLLAGPAMATGGRLR